MILISLNGAILDTKNSGSLSVSHRPFINSNYAIWTCQSFEGFQLITAGIKANIGHHSMRAFAHQKRFRTLFNSRTDPCRTPYITPSSAPSALLSYASQTLSMHGTLTIIYRPTHQHKWAGVTQDRIISGAINEVRGLRINRICALLKRKDIVNLIELSEAVKPKSKDNII